MVLPVHKENTVIYQIDATCMTVDWLKNTVGANSQLHLCQDWHISVGLYITEK